MQRKKIAVLFGGCSSEYEVSLASAHAVITHLDAGSYEVIPVGITPDGCWFRFDGDAERIKSNCWQDQDCIPALLSPDRKTHGLVEWIDGKMRQIHLDAVFPVLHGKNGEDGTVQGLAELAGIPLVGCGAMASALCMDKDRAHKLAALAGVAVPRSLVLDSPDNALVPLPALNFPMFVKPVRAGSSFGVTKVYHADELPAALEAAFLHDDHVILEEAVQGFEVGCAILGTDKLFFGQVDEIELSDGFFNYEEKYTLKTSKIHMPARIDRETADRIKQTSAIIYHALGCSGFARVDCFLTPAGEIVFNEVNTIPGFTAHSRFPNMMRGAGLSFEDILRILVDQAVGA